MKKLMAMALAVGMAASLAACGGSSSSSSSGSSSSSSGSSAASSAVSEAVTDTTATTSSAVASASGEIGDFTTVTEGELHMATNAAFPPYESTTDDGGYEGIDVEIATEIANKLGLKLVVDDMDFSSVITSVQGGKEDIAMAGLTVDEKRKKNVDFTDTYATAVQAVIVPENSDIQTADDLSKADKIGVQTATTGDIYCQDDFGADHVTEYTNGATAVQALLQDKVDAVVIDDSVAKALAASADGLKVLDTAYATEEYAIGVSKENPALRNAVNTALAQLKADGTVQKIIDKYITE